MEKPTERLPGQPGTSHPPVEEQSDDGFDIANQLHLENAPIYLIQDKKVILDADLAKLFEVESRVLIRTVRREIHRFPVDFMFKLTFEEFHSLQKQTPDEVTFDRNKSTPYAFSEEGLVMAAQLLDSAKAVQINLEMVRNFVRLSKLCRNVDLSEQIEQLELKYDRHLSKIYNALETMQSNAKIPEERRIGFYVEPNK